MDDTPPHPDATIRDRQARLPRPVARLIHRDEVTVLELAVRGERVVAHEVSATDPGLVTGCVSISLGNGWTRLFDLLVATGYLSREAAEAGLSAEHANERWMPARKPGTDTRRVVEIIHAIEAEVERQRRERNGEQEDEQDA